MFFYEDDEERAKGYFTQKADVDSAVRDWEAGMLLENFKAKYHNPY